MREATLSRRKAVTIIIAWPRFCFRFAEVAATETGMPFFRRAFRIAGAIGYFLLGVTALLFVQHQLVMIIPLLLYLICGISISLVANEDSAW